jgi:ABC-type lipoprotein release transport system permease subunit
MQKLLQIKQGRNNKVQKNFQTESWQEYNGSIYKAQLSIEYG